jgi:hypothetical protein
MKLRQHRHTFLSQVIEQRYLISTQIPVRANSLVALLFSVLATLDADVTYFRTPEIAKTTRQGER